MTGIGKGRPKGVVAIRGVANPFLLAFLAIVLLAGGFFLGESGMVVWDVRSWPWGLIGGVVASFLFGGLVGASEILTRYRDEPLRATFNLSGCTYLFLNGLVALAAFVLVLLLRSGFTVQHGGSEFRQASTRNFQLSSF